LTTYVYRKISIDDIVKNAKDKLLESLVLSELNLEGIDIKLLTSFTNWGGKRVWFSCPTCKRRCGKILQTEEGYKCNQCIKKV
jgi:hypothetical protein